jgi:pyridoxamine 5'-phosphate oxidase-like protein
MPSWRQVEGEAPELAARARELFDANKHKTLATLRRDGSPRISGTELEFADGEMWLGSMWKAVKALDLLRDPRFALHSVSDASRWSADAKVAGRAEEVTDPKVVAKIVGGAAPDGQAHVFRLDIEELVVVGLGGDPPDHLVIESWHAGRGVERRRR